MNAREYHDTHDKADLAELCAAAGTNYAYWRQIAYGHRKPSWALARRLEDASGGLITARELRPDIHHAMAGGAP